MFSEVAVRLSTRKRGGYVLTSSCYWRVGGVGTSSTGPVWRKGGVGKDRVHPVLDLSGRGEGREGTLTK